MLFREYILSSQVQSVPITTKVVSTNPVHGGVYSIQHYVIKFVSDLRQVSGFHDQLKLVFEIWTLIKKAILGIDVFLKSYTRKTFKIL
jgi:hypothetical protein